MNIDEAGRSPKSTKSSIDLTVPLRDTFTISKDDCFSNLWDMGTSQCRLCHDSEVCGILFSEKVADMEAKIEKENPTFLDKADFEALDELEIKIWLSGSKRTVDDLFDKIQEESKVSDEVAIAEWMKRFLRNAKYKVRDGVILVK